MSALFEYKGQAVPVKRDYNGARYDESLRSDFTVRAENYEQVVQKVTEQLRELGPSWSWRVDVLTLAELETLPEPQDPYRWQLPRTRRVWL